MSIQVIATLFACLLFCQSSIGNDQELGHEFNVSSFHKAYVRSWASGNHCGLYAAAAALNAIGVKSEPADYLRSEYISSPAGSSVMDLVRLVEAADAQVAVTHQLNGSTLYFSQYPILIHLDGSRRVERTNHWVTYLGMREGQPLIFDPPHEPQAIAFGDLLSQTSGVGIVVMPTDAIPAFPRNWVDKVELTVWIAFVLVLLLGVKRRIDDRNLLGGFLVLFSVALLLSAVQQAFPWSGYLNDPITIGNFSERYQTPLELDSVGFDEVEQLRSLNAVNIVDARLPADFANGHLPGAINWPVDASSVEARNATRRLDMNKPVLVYCQSEACSWGDSVGTRLSRRGFPAVKIYRGGWRDWSGRQQ